MPLNNKEEIITIIRNMFHYADTKQWQKLKNEIFSDTIYMDSDCFGNNKPNDDYPVEEFIGFWADYTQSLDGVHRIINDIIVNFTNQSEADVFVTSNILHFKKNQTKQSTRELIGMHQIKLIYINNTWKVNGYLYELNHTTGNENLELLN